MPETTLWQPGFIYRVCRSSPKSTEQMQKFKEKRDTRHIYQNKLDKAYFQNDMGVGDFKDLLSGTTTNKTFW